MLTKRQLVAIDVLQQVVSVTGTRISMRRINHNNHKKLNRLNPGRPPKGSNGSRCLPMMRIPRTLASMCRAPNRYRGRLLRQVLSLRLATKTCAYYAAQRADSISPQAPSPAPPINIASASFNTERAPNSLHTSTRIYGGHSFFARVSNIPLF